MGESEVGVEALDAKKYSPRVEGVSRGFPAGFSIQL